MVKVDSPPSSVDVNCSRSRDYYLGKMADHSIFWFSTMLDEDNIVIETKAINKTIKLLELHFTLHPGQMLTVVRMRLFISMTDMNIFQRTTVLVVFHFLF